MSNIEEKAKILKLPHIRKNYKEMIDEAMTKNYSYEQFIDLILEEELIERTNNSIRERLHLAKFPSIKTFEQFDFDSLPLLVANKVKELQSLSFLSSTSNIILIGNPGVGKTHIAIALGVEACKKNKSVLFTSIPNLIIELKEKAKLAQLSVFKKRFVAYDLVILDELGYISYDKEGSELLFNLLSSRSEKKPVIITSNLMFDRWHEVFNDSVITAAMVDRLTHKAHVVVIEGESYRMKETKKWLNA